MARYDDARFRVIHRQWFGLTIKNGGSVADGGSLTFGSATTTDQVARWYPRGPIRVLKIGALVVATLSTPATNASVAQSPVRVYKSNATGTAKSTLLASMGIDGDDTNRVDLWGIASKMIMASAEVEAGRFITIRTGSPLNAVGVEGTLGTIDGSVAFFIDWAPKFDPTKWDDGTIGL